MSAFLRLLFVDPSLNRIRLRLALIAWLAILVLGSIPGARADIGRVASGLVLHSVAYAGLTVLIFCGVGSSAMRRALASVLAIAVMGALDECIQSFFPYRGAAVGDWLVDCTAAVLAAAAMFALWPRTAPTRAGMP